MIVDIAVPELGESISQVEVSEWLVEIGQSIARDQEVVAVDSDKATVEVPAPEGGVLVEILKQQGESAEVGEVIGRIDTEKEGDSAAEPAEDAPSQEDEKPSGRQ
ncbi:MAG: biotin/lipoyl-containing protein, partial [Desulforhopalus sp.]